MARRRPIGTPTLPSIIAAVIVGGIGYFLTKGGLHWHTATFTEDEILTTFLMISVVIISISEILHPKNPKW